MDTEPKSVVDYASGNLDSVLGALRQARYEFRSWRSVRVWPDRIRVTDVNGDSLEVRGIGFQVEEVKPVLDAVNAVYRPDEIHTPTDQEYKEFKTGRRYPWAADRCM